MTRRLTADTFLRVTSGQLCDAPGAVVDQTTLPGRSIAERAGIPFVTVCAALLFNQEANVPPAVTG